MTKRPACDFSGEICRPFLRIGERRHGVLLIHGFSGSVAHMRLIADGLYQRGFTVMGINLPGHATDMDDMARFTWQDWLGAAKDAFMQLKERCDFVSVAGLSMGGCLSLILGEEMQPTAIVPISAPMGTQMPLWLSGPTRPFIRTIWWKPRGEDAYLIDARYDCGYPGFHNRCAPHLNKLIKLARRDLHAITCPVLVVQSHADTVITPDSARIILDGVSSDRKGVLWLDDVPHACTISREADHIAAAIAEHLVKAEQG